MIALVIAATGSVCGDAEICVKCGALLIYPVVTLLIYGSTRRLFAGSPHGAGVAFWSALVFFTLPGVSFSAMIISTDVPLFLFWALAFYAYLRALQDGTWRWWLLAGFAGGLGLQTKYTMGIFAVSVFLHLVSTHGLRSRLRDPKLYAALLLAGIVFAPNVWWNAQHGWPTVHHTTQISHLDSDAGLHWNHLGEFLGGQFALMGPLLFAIWLWLLLRPSAWGADDALRMLTIFAVPFLGIICLQALLGRANANWGAMAYATATPFSVALLIRQGRLRLLRWAFGVNLALMPLVYHFDLLKSGLNAVAQLAGDGPVVRIDPFKRVRGWAELGRQATAVQAQYPEALILGDSRDILAELEYYVRPHPLGAVLWNPLGVIDSHYALTTTMQDKRGRDFIFITRDPSLPPQVLASFTWAEALPPLHVTVDPAYALDFNVWYLKGFLGYAVPPRAGNTATDVSNPS